MDDKYALKDGLSHKMTAAAKVILDFYAPSEVCGPSKESENYVIVDTKEVYHYLLEMLPPTYELFMAEYFMMQMFPIKILKEIEALLDSANTKRIC